MSRVAFALVAVAACLAVATAQEEPYPTPSSPPPLPENIGESVLPFDKFWGMGEGLASSKLPTGQTLIATAARTPYDPATMMSEPVVVVSELMPEGGLRMIFTIKASGPAGSPASDSFGSSVAMVGSTVLIASPWHTASEGHVFVYECSLDTCTASGDIVVPGGAGSIIKANGRSLLVTEEAYSPDHQMRMFRKNAAGMYDPVNPIPLSDSTMSSSFPNAVFVNENHIIFTRLGGLEINEFGFDEATGQWSPIATYPTPFTYEEFGTRLAFDEVSQCFVMYAQYGMRPNSLWCKNPDMAPPSTTTPPPPSYVFVRELKAPRAPGSMDPSMGGERGHFARFVAGHFVYTANAYYPYTRFPTPHNSVIIVTNMDDHVVASHQIPGRIGFEGTGTTGFSLLAFKDAAEQVSLAFTSPIYKETMHPDGTWTSVTELGFYTVKNAFADTREGSCERPAGQARYYSPLDCIVDPYCHSSLHGDCTMPAFEYEGVRYFCRMDSATVGMQVVFSGCGGPAPMPGSDGSMPGGDGSMYSGPGGM